MDTVLNGMLALRLPACVRLLALLPCEQVGAGSADPNMGMTCIIFLLHSIKIEHSHARARP